MLVLRPILELGNSNSFSHSSGKGNRISLLVSYYIYLVYIEHYSCEYGSVKYYIYCGIAGMLSCGVTHTAVVPLVSIKDEYFLYRSTDCFCVI